MTLPLIYALNNASRSDKRNLINIVKNHNKDKKKVNEAIDFVIKSGGLEYAESKMHEHRKQAIDILHEFPENEARNSIEKLVIYSTDRKK